MKTLNELSTNAEVIQYVEDFLTAQACKSESRHNGYSYISYDDSDNANIRKCAIGCLIKYEYYNPDFEGQTVTSYGVMNAVEKSLPNWKIDMDLLQQLQTIHDSFAEDLWEWKFSRLRSQY